MSGEYNNARPSLFGVNPFKKRTGRSAGLMPLPPGYAASQTAQFATNASQRPTALFNSPQVDEDESDVDAEIAALPDSDLDFAHQDKQLRVSSAAASYGIYPPSHRKTIPSQEQPIYPKNLSSMRQSSAGFYKLQPNTSLAHVTALGQPRTLSQRDNTVDGGNEKRFGLRGLGKSLFGRKEAEKPTEIASPQPQASPQPSSVSRSPAPQPEAKSVEEQLKKHFPWALDSNTPQTAVNVEPDTSGIWERHLDEVGSLAGGTPPDGTLSLPKVAEEPVGQPSYFTGDEIPSAVYSNHLPTPPAPTPPAPAPPAPTPPDPLTRSAPLLSPDWPSVASSPPTSHPPAQRRPVQTHPLWDQFLDERSEIAKRIPEVQALSGELGRKFRDLRLLSGSQGASQYLRALRLANFDELNPSDQALLETSNKLAAAREELRTHENRAGQLGTQIPSAYGPYGDLIWTSGPPEELGKYFQEFQEQSPLKVPFLTELASGGKRVSSDAIRAMSSVNRDASIHDTEYFKRGATVESIQDPDYSEIQKVTYPDGSWVYRTPRIVPVTTLDGTRTWHQVGYVVHTDESMARAAINHSRALNEGGKVFLNLVGLMGNGRLASPALHGPMPQRPLTEFRVPDQRYYKLPPGYEPGFTPIQKSGREANSSRGYVQQNTPAGGTSTLLRQGINQAKQGETVKSLIEYISRYLSPSEQVLLKKRLGMQVSARTHTQLELLRLIQKDRRYLYRSIQDAKGLINECPPEALPQLLDDIVNHADFNHGDLVALALAYKVKGSALLKKETIKRAIFIQRTVPDALAKLEAELAEAQVALEKTRGSGTGMEEFYRHKIKLLEAVVIRERQSLAFARGEGDVLDLNNYDFGNYLKKLVGDPPADMYDPHAHHLLFKKGLGTEQQALVIEGQAILREYDIDPIFGPEVLGWAPNRVAGQHGKGALEEVVAALMDAKEFGATREEVVVMLTKFKKAASKSNP